MRPRRRRHVDVGADFEGGGVGEGVVAEDGVGEEVGVDGISSAARLRFIR